MVDVLYPAGTKPMWNLIQWSATNIKINILWLINGRPNNILLQTWEW